MSSYNGAATLESYLEAEIFEVREIPQSVVALFEEHREYIEEQLESYFELEDDEYGLPSWRQFNILGLLTTQEMIDFEDRMEQGKALMR